MIEFRVPEFKVPYFSAMYDIEQGMFFDHVQRHSHEKILHLINDNQTVIFNLTRDQYHGALRNQTVNQIKTDLDKKGYDNIIYITNEVEHIEVQDHRIIFCPLWFYSKYIDYRSIPYEITKIKKHNISCLNRFPFSHKVYIYYKLSIENYLKDNNLISYYGLRDPYNFRNLTLEELLDIPVDLKEKMSKIDIVNERCCLPGDNLWNNDHSFTHPAFSDAYLNIITESTYCTTFFTEKTCKPICAGQLFLSPNAKHNLKALRHFGFEVFDEEFNSHYYINYDNFIERIDQMFNLLQDIYIDLPTLYTKNLDKIKHNRNLFLSDYFIAKLLTPLLEKNLIYTL